VSVAVDIRRTPRRTNRERGAALVEFSISIVLLLVLLFGIIEYGYMLSFKQALTQAAAEGARAGVVSSDATGAAAAAAVKNSTLAFNQTCNTGGLSCKNDAGVWPPAATTCGTNTCVTVQLTYDWKNYPLLPKFPGLGLIMPDTLKSTSVARVN
jgi:Flp pilus assembly protein TadG